MRFVSSLFRHSLRRAAVALAFFSMACGSDPVAPAPSPGSAASIAMDAPPAEIYVSDDISLSAVVRDSLGNPVSGAPITWSVDLAANAEISGTHILFLKPGALRITARSGQLVASRDVMVRDLVVERVVVSTSPMMLVQGELRLIGIRLVGAGDRTVTGKRVQVSIENPAVARLDSAGRLHGVAGGVTNVVATAEGKTGTGRVEVLPIASRFDLTRRGEARLPLLHTMDTLFVNGVPEYHEIYLERGSLVFAGLTSSHYVVHVIFADYVVTYPNGQKLLTLRYVQDEADRGVIIRDASGAMRLQSTYTSPLEHAAVPENGGIRMQFRIPGDNEIMSLFYRPDPDFP